MQYQATYRIGRVAGIVGVVAAAVLFCDAPGSLHAHEGHAALPSTGATVEGDQVLVSEGARKGLGLETATVTLDQLTRVLRVHANVELPWDGQAMVTTLVPGRVQAIHVKPGEPVQAGQELARIESFELETLQLTMLQAAEQVDLAQRLVEQRRPLVERGAVPGTSLLEAETQLRQARVQLAITEQKLMALGVSSETLQTVRSRGVPVKSIPVISPIAGVVMHADVRTGQFVDTEQHLFNIVDRAKLLVIGEVLETDAWQIEPGQRVEATFPAVPGQTFNGQIARVRLGINATQRTLEVVIPVDNQNGWLRPGMSGRLEITVDQADQAIVCPTAALINTPQRTFVLLRQGEGKYQRREIEIGLRTPKKVQVLNGLFPGDKVIVTGTKLLASMFHTEVKPEDQDSAPAESHSGRVGTLSSDASPAGAIPVAQAVVELPTAHKALVTPVIEGRVAGIHVQPGQQVEAGQVLADLDSQELRSLQLELLETQENLRRISETIQRVQSLVRSGSYPESQLWQHQMEQRNLQLQLQNAERKLLMVGLEPEDIRRLRSADLGESGGGTAFLTVPVRAPAAGTLGDTSVAPGQIVHANDVLFEVQDLSTVWIEGYVFEQHASQVQVGQSAEIRFPAHPDLQLTGKVVRTAPTLASSARVLPVWIEVENPSQLLREGMLAELSILRQPTSGQVAALPPAQD